MNKLFSTLILFILLSFNFSARAQNAEPVDYGFVLLDVLLYRPVGFVATLAGGAAFLGISPLTAFASIPAPHDAFQKTFNVLVAAPGIYTFIRPVGDRRYLSATNVNNNSSYPHSQSTHHANPNMQALPHNIKPLQQP